MDKIINIRNQLSMDNYLVTDGSLALDINTFDEGAVEFDMTKDFKTNLANNNIEVNKKEKPKTYVVNGIEMSKERYRLKQFAMHEMKKTEEEKKDYPKLDFESTNEMEFTYFLANVYTYGLINIDGNSKRAKEYMQIVEKHFDKAFILYEKWGAAYRSCLATQKVIEKLGEILIKCEKHKNECEVCKEISEWLNSNENV